MDNIGASGLQFQVMSAGNLAIAAGLLITVILVMLLVLVTAVCCYRRNVAYKWGANTGYTSGTLAGLQGAPGHYNMMDVSGPLDQGGMKYFCGGFNGYAQQAFVDPTYYDDIDKLFLEFTREIHVNQLQSIEGHFGMSTNELGELNHWFFILSVDTILMSARRIICGPWNVSPFIAINHFHSG